MKKRILMIACMLMALFMPTLDMAAIPAQAAVTPAVVELSDTNIVIDLAQGTKYTLSANVLPEEASQRIKWSTSSSSIVKVSSSGVLTARKRGTATITATARNTKVKATCTVTVIDSDVPDSIDIGTPTLTMNRFDTCQLTPVVSPSTAVQKVKWKTSRSSVVSCGTRPSSVWQVAMVPPVASSKIRRDILAPPCVGVMVMILFAFSQIKREILKNLGVYNAGFLC